VRKKRQFDRPTDRPTECCDGEGSICGGRETERRVRDEDDNDAHCMYGREVGICLLSWVCASAGNVVCVCV